MELCLSNVCYSFTYFKWLLHFKKTKWARRLFERRDLVGFTMSPDWLKTRSLAAELDGALNSFNAIGLKLASWVSLKTSKPAAGGKFSKRWKSRLGSGWSWSRTILDPADRAPGAMKSNSFIFFDLDGSDTATCCGWRTTSTRCGGRIPLLELARSIIILAR